MQKHVRLDATPLKCMPLLQKCIWYHCNLDLCPWHWKPFQ